MTRQRSTPSTRVPLAACLLSALAACGGADERSTLQVHRDTIGDTVVVRTVAGQAWDADAVLEPDMRIGVADGPDAYILGDVGGIAVDTEGAVYLFDRQVPALRKYSADGEYLATFGRDGGGPGEYSRSDGGIAILPDGRVLLRDPGNGRINVYGPNGEALDHWELPGGDGTPEPLYMDTAANVYAAIRGTDDAGRRYAGLQRTSPLGEPLDTILAPDWDHEPARLSVVTRFGGSMEPDVPFGPRKVRAFHPHGYYVGGVSTDYSFDLFRPDGSVLRIQRVADPVPVDPDEAENTRERMSAAFRAMAPDWKWNGPAIPDTKPPFTRIRVGRDGRIWVKLSQPGERLSADEIGPSDEPGALPPKRWTEPVAYDIFETDGTYLGQVSAPDGWARYPLPVFGRDHAWAIATDDLGVESLVRYRITPVEADADAK